MHELKVADAMTRGAVTVPPGADLESVAELLLACGIGGAPVVEGDGRLVGIVSQSDLLRAREWSCDDPEPAFDPTCSARSVRQVRDVMMPFAFTVREEMSLTAVAALLANEGVHRAPVVTGSGLVVGILTTPTSAAPWRGQSRRSPRESAPGRRLPMLRTSLCRRRDGDRRLVRAPAERQRVDDGHDDERQERQRQQATEHR